MSGTGETFDFNATLALIGNALGTVVVTIGFQVAAIGFALALIIGTLGLISLKQGKRTGKPLLNVCRKLAIVCTILGIPGTVVLVINHHLPPVNQLSLHPIGLVGFWALVIAHLCMEEMNFNWFPEN